MAIAISLLSLWTSIGGSIGSAIAASIWTNKLPMFLEQHLGNVLNSTQIDAIYGDIITARAAEPRDQVIAGTLLLLTPSLFPPLFYGTSGDRNGES